MVVASGKLAGTGPAKIGGKAACVDGDEAKIQVSGCKYTTTTFTTPGTGTLMIDKLAGDQKTKKTNTGGKAVLLKGSKFTAKFQVTMAATDPTSGASDLTTKYSGGSGTFMNNNATVRGS